jgi:hypothetical protein
MPASTTPKFDAIQVEFSRRINDPAATALTAGTVLSVADRNTYVNKALNLFFARQWEAVRGDKEKFIMMFPELVKIATVALTSAVYAITSTLMRNYHSLVSGKAVTSGKYVRVERSSLLHVRLTGFSPTFAPDADNPSMIEQGGNIYVFPTSVSGNLDVAYIAQPLTSTDGSFLVQDTGQDSPFYPIWNSKIAAVAEELYRIDTAQST